MRILIISGGRIEDAFADAYIQNYRPQYLIAADGGMDYCRRSNRIPDCIVGDFDSVKPETLEYFQTFPQIIWKQFQPEKDETDTELAMRTAFEHGADELHILGATGSRLDHVLANIQLLYQALIRDIPTYLVDANNRIALVDGERTIKKNEQYGKYVSILPLTTTAEGVTLKGFAYPLTKAVLYSSNSLGVSNEIVDEEAKIELEKGIAIVIESKD